MTKGYLALVLHAHLPFVRHPEHERSLEESWLFEAITETYVPLLRMADGWQKDGLKVRLTLTLTPTLCAMLRDKFLQSRYRRHLEDLILLAEKEIHRTTWEPAFQSLAVFYHERFSRIYDYYEGCDGDLVGAFRRQQESEQFEIITSAATHAVLPLLRSHSSAIRAQLLVARDDYRECFGCEPRGIWLPECAYFRGLETFLAEAGLRWFIIDTEGLLRATPRPCYGVFAPVLTPNGLAAFGRDHASARQVWSRDEGYPGDPRYRDFYRDIGFDLELEYLKPHLAAPDHRNFTGLKYYRITGRECSKAAYERRPALEAAVGHAAHFLGRRLEQLNSLSGVTPNPPLIVAPYDAELFGHWWYEGPEFLDCVVRIAWEHRQQIELISPEDYLARHPTNQVALPADSSWGEAGFWEVWLNEKNQWIYPHLHAAQERMTELARRFPGANGVHHRALQQAARELLLAQASDWPFILRTGTSPDYARQRIKDHLLRFRVIYEQLIKREEQAETGKLAQIEMTDPLFPRVNPQYWS